VSTHPLTDERVAMVRAQPAYPTTPALSDADWRAMREMCGATVSPAQRQPAAPTPAQPGSPNPSQGQSRGTPL